jgi:cation-transporting ATPase 13A1
MRKILFATESTTGNSKETFGFIAVLVLFAIVAAGFVLHEGVNDAKRNKFRLVLHCIMIITSVVPPELPMELSLAVTNSLAALSKQMIFCTEPYRIPFAGKLNVVCFDKTGTLTKDEMVLKGIVAGQNIDIFTGKLKKETREGNDEEEEEDEDQEEDQGGSGAMIAPETTTDFVQCINGTCHDLVERKGFFTTQGGVQKNEILGDPLEIASFETSGFDFVSEQHGVSDANAGSSSSFGVNDLVNSSLCLQAKILHKFPFQSDLKRMSTVVMFQSLVQHHHLPSSYYIFSKGAPEILQNHLKEIPANYMEFSQHHMQAGKRVLTLAYKKITESQWKNNSFQHRSNAEKDLIFAGFLIFDCDLKVDSRSVIKDLINSNHKVIMITGDSVYTAANVGKRVALYENNRIPLILSVVREQTNAHNNSNNSKNNKLVWRRTDIINEGGDPPLIHASDLPFRYEDLNAELTKKYVLCISGASIDYLIEQEHHQHSSSSQGKQKQVSFSGVENPDAGDQGTKELISADFIPVIKRLCPFITIFARVSPIQKEKIILSYNELGFFTLMCGDGTNDVGALKSAYVGVSIINNPKLEKKVEDISKSNKMERKEGSKKSGGGGTNKDRLERAMLEFQEHEADPTIVKLGDASIASPFTAKRTSIDSVLTVIRQGRCTLVGTIQVRNFLHFVFRFHCVTLCLCFDNRFIKSWHSTVSPLLS